MAIFCLFNDDHCIHCLHKIAVASVLQSNIDVFETIKKAATDAAAQTGKSLDCESERRKKKQQQPTNAHFARHGCSMLMHVIRLYRQTYYDYVQHFFYIGISFIQPLADGGVVVMSTNNYFDYFFIFFCC